MATWTSVDSRSHLSAADADLLAQLDQALKALDRHRRSLPSVAHLLRDHQAGQPRAAATDREVTGVSPWCWTHERTLSDCHRAEQDCIGGDNHSGPGDPTGNAAVGPDPAARDLGQLRGAIRQVTRSLDHITAIAGRYPTQPQLPLDPTDDPDDDGLWCRSCIRDSGYCEPVALRPNGTPWVKGYCSWCATARRELGALPPVWLLERRHRGERITTPLMERARLETTSARKKSKKSKSKRRSA